MVDAPVLREAALFYAECNLPEISQQDGFQDTMAGSLDIAQALLARLKATAARAEAAGTASARTNQSRIQAQTNVGEKRGNDDDDDGDKTFRPDSPFPWQAAGVACACGGVYYNFSSVVAVGMFVPILNGVFFVGLAIFAFQKLRASRDASYRPTRRGAAHKYRSGRSGGRGGYGGARQGSEEQYAKRQRSTYLFG